MTNFPQQIGENEYLKALMWRENIILQIHSTIKALLFMSIELNMYISSV